MKRYLTIIYGGRELSIFLAAFGYAIGFVGDGATDRRSRDRGADRPGGRGQLSRWACSRPT